MSLHESSGSEESWKWEEKRENKNKNKNHLLQFSALVTINLPQKEENDNLCDTILTLLLRSS